MEPQPLILDMMMYGVFKAQVAKVDENGEKKRNAKGDIMYEYKNRKYTPENSNGIYPSVNHMYVNGPKGSKRLAKGAEDLKEKWYIAAQMWAKDNEWEMTSKEKIVVECIPYFPSDNKARDASNALKLMLDAFEGVIYKNDVFALPRIMDIRKVSDLERPYFEVTIYKKDDENAIAHYRANTQELQEA